MSKLLQSGMEKCFQTVILKCGCNKGKDGTFDCEHKKLLHAKITVRKTKTNDKLGKKYLQHMNEELIHLICRELVKIQEKKRSYSKNRQKILTVHRNGSTKSL